MGPFFDMHCHLDFASNAAEAAYAIDTKGAGMFSATVLPGNYDAACEAVSSVRCVRVGVGLHPWWVTDNAEEMASRLEHAQALIATTPFVGEVGLDFAPAHVHTRDEQLHAFRTLAQTCAQEGNKVLTIHAVRSADTVLDVLDTCGVLDTCACILHWFSGSSQELTRALKAGCFISLGAQSLATKRGRAYAKAIPVKQLLLETDYPAQGDVYDVERMQQSMRDTLNQIALQRNEDAEGLSNQIACTSRALLTL